MFHAHARVALFALVLAVSAASGSIVLPAPVPATDWIELGQVDRFVVGDKLFDDFGVVSTSVGGAIAPEGDIKVRGVTFGQDIGLEFTGGWLALPGQLIQTNISFTVTVLDPRMLIKDNVLWVSSYGANGTGAVSVVEQVFAFENGLVTLDALATKDVLLTAAGGSNADMATFRPVSGVLVKKDIIVTGGTDGDAHLSNLYQSFSQIPEPATMSLLGVGMLGLLLKRRR